MRSSHDATDATPGSTAALAPRKKRSTRRTAEDYDGSKIKRKRPKDYKVAVTMLAAGIAKNRISKTVGICWSTVTGIERTEIVTIQEQRQLLADLCFVGAIASLNSAIERARKGKATALDAKLLLDMWLKLEGQAPPVQAHVHRFPALDEWENLGSGRKVIDQSPEDWQ